MTSNGITLLCGTNDALHSLLYLVYGFLGFLLIIIALILILRSPYKYPYYRYKFDISKKRQPEIDELLDQLLIEKGIDQFSNHYDKINAWKEKCQAKMTRSLLKPLRKKQFAKACDDEHAFVFQTIRKVTKYKQKNYVKKSYLDDVAQNEYSYSYQYISSRYNQLEIIDFECTLNEWNSKNQRRLMTRELREQIMKRDNYTCKFCGKYMPDEVGLHIDHIIPVAKGGKSVPSNLQVLCSKCNGKKSNKLISDQ